MPHATHPHRGPRSRIRAFDPDRLHFDILTGRFTQQTAAAYLGVSSPMLKKLIDLGQAPPFHKVGVLRIWTREDLDRWIQARRVEPTPGPQIRIKDRSAA